MVGRKSEDGFALVVSLFVLLVLLSLGVGAVFLSTMNLRLAENTRANAIAVANAETGLDLAVVMLSQVYDQAEPRQFPAAFGDDQMASFYDADVSYFVAGYERFSPVLARVAMRGVGPRGAEHVAEALIGSTIDEIEPIYSFGLVSEQLISIDGASGTLIDAGMHSNIGLSTPGWGPAQFKYCAGPRDLVTLQCPEAYQTLYPTEGEPLSVYEGGSLDCSPPGNPFCVREGRATVVKPVYRVEDELEVKPEYYARRYQAAGGKVDASTGAFLGGGAISEAGIVSGQCESLGFLCHYGTDELVLSPADLVGLAGVISQGNVRIECEFEGACPLSDKILMSMTGAVDVSAITEATSVRVFSELDLTADGQWKGASTLASAGSITLQGTQQMFLLDNKVSVAIIAELDVTVTGGGGTQTPAIFVVGRNLDLRGGGGTYIVGSALVKGTVLIEGGITIDSGLDTSNPDIGGVRGDAEVFSRR